MGADMSSLDLSTIVRTLRGIAESQHSARSKALEIELSQKVAETGSTARLARHSANRKHSGTPISMKARALRDLRRATAAAFPGGMIGDPVFDMLLDFLIAEEEGFRLTVSDILKGEVPATTALRWVTRLEGDGFLVRTSDSRDRRRYYMSLTSDALSKVRELVEHSPLNVIDKD